MPRVSYQSRVATDQQLCSVRLSRCARRLPCSVSLARSTCELIEVAHALSLLSVFFRTATYTVTSMKRSLGIASNLSTLGAEQEQQHSSCNSSQSSSPTSAAGLPPRSTKHQHKRRAICRIQHSELNHHLSMQISAPQQQQQYSSPWAFDSSPLSYCFGIEDVAIHEEAMDSSPFCVGFVKATESDDCGDDGDGSDTETEPASSDSETSYGDEDYLSSFGFLSASGTEEADEACVLHVPLPMVSLCEHFSIALRSC